MKQIFTFIGLLLSSALIAQCDFGAHSINWEDAWLSCESSQNPNPERGEGHWIMYDLGSPHAFFESHIWNLNVPGSTGQGARNCYFDFSVDGENWTTWGTFEVDEAPGNDDYTGQDGPYFDGAVGRYLLITIDTNWNGGDCSGFAEIKVDIEDTTVDVAEYTPTLAFSAFPNPVSDQLTIRHFESGSLQLEVFNGSGQLVFSEQIFGTTSYLNVSSWDAGIYLIVLRNNEGTRAVQRVVVQ